MALARFIAALFCRWRRRSSASPEESPHLALGRRGEEIAERALRREGFKILYRNFKSRHGGELDLVCRDKACDTLVFVEVKTRTTDAYGRPGEAVTPDKQRHISRGALAWLRLLDNPDIKFRFDIVEVVLRDSGPEVTILRDAFALSEPYLY